MYKSAQELENKLGRRCAQDRTVEIATNMWRDSVAGSSETTLSNKEGTSLDELAKTLFAKASVKNGGDSTVDERRMELLA
jgi:hypothetical protein